MAELLQPPAAQTLLQAWLPFKQALGVTDLRSGADYTRARATLDVLLDEVADQENHPLAEVMDYLAERIKSYEDRQWPLPEAEPKEVLRFLMVQHDLKQDDLSDCAPQSRISDILSGKRAISKEIAKRLARRFHVHADVFL